MQHNETIIEQFYLQAIPFAELPGHSDSMQMLIQLSGVSTADNVLDMAASSLLPTIRAHRWAAASALIPVRQRPARSGRHARNEKGADIAVVARKLRCITMYFYIARL